MTLNDIAQVAHEMNKALCEADGDMSQVPWAQATEENKESTLDSVKFHLHNPKAPPSASHDTWVKFKLGGGWAYGPVKSAEDLTHPDLISFDRLSPMAQAKDRIASAITRELSRFLTD